MLCPRSGTRQPCFSGNNYIYLYMSIYMCVYMYVCIYVLLCPCFSGNNYIYVYIYIYIYTSIHMYIHIYCYVRAPQVIIIYETSLPLTHVYRYIHKTHDILSAYTRTYIHTYIHTPLHYYTCL